MTLFPLLGLKLPLCNARCVPANGDKQGIWKQLACAWYLGLVLCSLAMCCAGPVDLSPTVSHTAAKVVGGFFSLFLLLKYLLLILHVNKLHCLQQRQYLNELVNICGDLRRNARKMSKCYIV